jgi:hypothetical protein
MPLAFPCRFDRGLAPSEAATLAAVVEKWRSAYELSELERRLSALEART